MLRQSQSCLDGLFRVEKQGTCIPCTHPSPGEDSAGSSWAHLLHHAQPILWCLCVCVIRKNELVSRIGRLEATTIGEVGEVDKKVECCQNVEYALKSKFDVDVDHGNHHHHSLNWRQSRMI
ncbi:unnamed protein product [Musa hybrid cultivar]